MGHMFRVRGLIDGVDYHRVLLRADGHWEDADPFDDRADLVETGRGIARIITGIAMGVVDLELQIHDQPEPSTTRHGAGRWSPRQACSGRGGRCRWPT